ncbi:MAG TPA: hypothetical protein VIS06_10695 [Mycobacteriales bacterium]
MLPRARGNIRRRGASFQVRVYAGIDPLTGQQYYLTGSTTDDLGRSRPVGDDRAGGAMWWNR